MSRYTILPSGHQIISAARRASIAARADRLRMYAAEMGVRRRRERGEDMLPGLQPVTGYYMPIDGEPDWCGYCGGSEPENQHYDNCPLYVPQQIIMCARDCDCTAVSDCPLEGVSPR